MKRRSVTTDQESYVHGMALKPLALEEKFPCVTTVVASKKALLGA